MGPACLATGFRYSEQRHLPLRLKSEVQQEGVRILHGRVHRFIYYPLLAVVVLTGFWYAFATDAFAQGRWLHWKLVFVVLLAGLGLLTGQGVRSRRPLRPLAIAVHVLIFIVSACIFYLAVLKPY